MLLKNIIIDNIDVPNYDFSASESDLYALGFSLYFQYKKDDYVDLVALKKDCYSLKSNKNKNILAPRSSRYNVYKRYKKAIDFYLFISKKYCNK